MLNLKCSPAQRHKLIFNLRQYYLLGICTITIKSNNHCYESTGLDSRDEIVVFNNHICHSINTFLKHWIRLFEVLASSFECDCKIWARVKIFVKKFSFQFLHQNLHLNEPTSTSKADSPSHHFEAKNFVILPFKFFSSEWKLSNWGILNFGHCSSSMLTAIVSWWN